MSQNATMSPIRSLINVCITMTLAPIGLLLAVLADGKLTFQMQASYGAVAGEEKAVEASNERITYWDMATPMLAWVLLVAVAAWLAGGILAGIGAVTIAGVALSILDVVFA